MSSAIRRLSLSLSKEVGAAKSLGASLSTLPSPSLSEEEQHHIRSHHEIHASPTPPKRNIKLEAIKSVGITQLHNHTQDIIARARQPLFEDDPVDAHGHKRQSIAQIQEATRMESALIDALAHYSSRQSTFSVGGQCIEVLGVEVSADLKQARAFWCLPRSLDLHTIPDSKIQQLIIRMQQILDERGGKIQGLVHARLRAYHPPKIIFVAAEHVRRRR
jgi:ribosome-binding factor A